MGFPLRLVFTIAGTLLLSSCSSPSRPEDPDPHFIRTYGGAWRESASAVVECGDGGFLMAGDSLRRTDRFGNELWVHEPWAPDGYVLGLQVLPSGRIFGVHTGPPSVFELDCEGTVIWDQVVASRYLLFRNKSYAVTGDSNIIVQTSMTSLTLLGDDGSVVWSRSYECPDMTDYYWGVAASPDGGFMFIGRDISEGYSPYRLRGVKIDSEGELQWQRMLEPVMGTNSYAPTGGSAQLLGVTDGYLLLDHGYRLFATEPDSIVYGTTESTLRKLDPEGAVVWSMSFFRPDDPFQDRSIGRITSTRDGGIAALGSMRVSGYLRPYLVRMDREGNILWDKTYGSTYDRFSASGIHQTEDGGFVLVGSQSNGSGYDTGWIPLVIRTSASGDI